MLEWLRKTTKKRLHIPPKEFRMILVISILSMLGALAIVWPNVRMVNHSYEYQALLKERRELLRENHLLKLEKASLQSLDRIQSLARSQIGLQSPGENQIVTVFLK